MTPTILLLLAGVAASDGADAPQPSALPADARKLQPLTRSALGRAFLKAAEGAPPYASRTVYRRGQRTGPFELPPRCRSNCREQRRPAPEALASRGVGRRLA